MIWIGRLFWFAGIYGLLVLAPQYLMERHIGIDFPPEITHPEYFYGFVGVTLAWQVSRSIRRIFRCRLFDINFSQSIASRFLAADFFD